MVSYNGVSCNIGLERLSKIKAKQFSFIPIFFMAAILILGPAAGGIQYAAAEKPSSLDLIFFAGPMDATIQITDKKGNSISTFNDLHPGDPFTLLPKAGKKKLAPSVIYSV